MILGMVSMTISLEKDLMSLRTKEALNAKKLKGIALGKPKGTIQKSKFDFHTYCAFLSDLNQLQNLYRVYTK